MAALGAFAGLPMASTASAAPGADVTFTSSGVAGLLCDSKPSTPSVTVGAETRIRLTNGLGAAAQLNIDGSPSATVADGETVEVQFHRGPVSITMAQSCLLPSDTKALTVAVTAVPPPVVQPSPTRPAPPVAQPQQSTKPPAGTNPQQTTAASLPPLPGDPLFPDDPANVAGAGTPGPQGDTLNSPPAVVVGAGGNGQTPRLASNTPLDKGPIGLLAIVATVCVVGVTAGAIRAIITQRATRVEFA
ncbi:hypothetical protein Rhe02_70180 [Rhizocola hellebori]|uniref:Uncharacterized protein n=2 Tax=Rhizocola hellebori TaxID=1392758 RepID=A0A8J3VKC8_9ACTN|nr:hypothetical protein Rhe02_70180 [Rhizocola hellebori]